MIKLFDLKARIRNMEIENRPWTKEQKLEKDERLKVLYWMYNNGNMKTQEELTYKLEQTEGMLNHYKHNCDPNSDEYKRTEYKLRELIVLDTFYDGF